MTLYSCNCISTKRFRKIFFLKKFPMFFGAIPENLKKIKQYPLEISICNKCKLIQQTKRIKEKILNKVYESKFYNCPAPTVSNIGKSEIEKFLKYFYSRRNKKKKLLEIACFDGFILKKLFKRKWDVYGSDPSPSTKELLKELGPKRIKQKYFNSNLFDTKFDIIILRNLLEHIYDIPKFLEELKKSLNINGKIYIDVPNIKETIKLGGFGSFFHQHVTYFSIETLNDILSKNGFVITHFKEGNPNLFAEVKIKNPKLQGLKFKLFNPEIVKIKKKYKKFKKKIKNLFQNKNSKYILFGASSIATSLMGVLSKKELKKIILIADNDIQKHNKYLSGSNIRISSPKKIYKFNYDKILILTYLFEKQIIKSLLKLGIKKNKISTLKF